MTLAASDEREQSAAEAAYRFDDVRLPGTTFNSLGFSSGRRKARPDARCLPVMTTG